MEYVTAYFSAAGVFGGTLVVLVGVSGFIVGALQAAVGRELNLWPLQLASGFGSVSLSITMAAWRMLEVYLRIGTIDDRVLRRTTLYDGYASSLLILKVMFLLMFLQILAGSIGRACFMNGKKPLPAPVPAKGPAFSELNGPQKAA